MADRAAELKAAFDRGFSDAVRGPRAATVDLLRVRVAGAPFAVRLDDVGALHVDLRICAVPTPARELLGVAAIRSSLIPIYDLRALLDAPTTTAPRWCAVARRGDGFAFDGFDGLLRVDALPQPGTGGRFTPRSISIDDRSVPVLDLDAVVESLRGRWPKEK